MHDETTEQLPVSLDFIPTGCSISICAGGTTTAPPMNMGIRLSSSLSIWTKQGGLRKAADQWFISIHRGSACDEATEASSVKGWLQYEVDVGDKAEVDASSIQGELHLDPICFDRLQTVVMSGSLPSRLRLYAESDQFRRISDDESEPWYLRDAVWDLEDQSGVHTGAAHVCGSEILLTIRGRGGESSLVTTAELQRLENKLTARFSTYAKSMKWLLHWVLGIAAVTLFLVILVWSSYT